VEHSILQLTTWPYTFVCLVLAARQLWRISQRGGWRAEGFLEARQPDLLIVAAVTLTVGIVYASLIWLGPVSRPNVWAAAVINSAIGLALAAPIAVRMLGEVAPRILIAIVMTAACATIVLQRERLEQLADVTGRPFADALVIGALALVLIPGQRWLRSAIDQLLLRRARRRHARLQDFLRTLSPELDVHECCRRALEEISQVMHSRGAAIILTDGDGALLTGTFATDAVASGSIDLPPLDRGLGVLEMSDLPSRSAMRCAKPASPVCFRSSARVGAGGTS